MQTNTYQAAIVTDNIYTYLFFTYSCGQMEWSTARSGLHAAVVGYNSGPLKRFNHPASGLDFIVEAVSCIDREGSAKRSITLGGVTPPPLGNNPFQGGTQLTNTEILDEDYLKCTILANCENVTEINEAQNTITPCPSSRTQAQEDHRFLVMEQPENNCYVWAFAIEKGDGQLGSKRTYTKQCCYNNK